MCFRLQFLFGGKNTINKSFCPRIDAHNTVEHGISMCAKINKLKKPFCIGNMSKTILYGRSGSAITLAILLPRCRTYSHGEINDKMMAATSFHMSYTISRFTNVINKVVVHLNFKQCTRTQIDTPWNEITHAIGHTRASTHKTHLDSHSKL